MNALESPGGIPNSGTLAEAREEIGKYYRERLRRMRLQQISLPEIAIDVETMADLFMPSSSMEMQAWMHERDSANQDTACAYEPFREFALNHADAMETRKTLHETLADAGHHEVAHRFEGWRSVIVSVSPQAGVRLIDLAPLTDEH